MTKKQNIENAISEASCLRMENIKDTEQFKDFEARLSLWSVESLKVRQEISGYWDTVKELYKKLSDAKKNLDNPPNKD